jgi:TolB protein
VEPDGTGRRRLTNNTIDDSDPTWSADSNRIAFTLYVTRTNAEIYTIAAAGGSLRRLTDHRAADHSPDWSSTGWIAWVRSHASGSQIRLVRADGSGRRLLFSTPRAVTSPTWSPDGARLAFELWDGEDTELYVIGFNGTGVRRLTNNDVSDFGPVWGPGSGRIAFTRFTTTNNDVWSMRPNGTDKRRLTTATTHDAVADWAADP